MNQHVTSRQLAASLDVDRRTLRKWTTAGCPVAERGRDGSPSQFDLAAVVEWKRARDERASREHAAFMEARGRHLLAQAVESEQRIAVRAGRLIPIEQVDLDWSGQVAAVRSRMLSWPVALSDRLARAAATEGRRGIRRILADAVEDALRELHVTTGRPETPSKPIKARTARKSQRKRKRPAKTRTRKAARQSKTAGALARRTH